MYFYIRQKNINNYKKGTIYRKEMPLIYKKNCNLLEHKDKAYVVSGKKSDINIRLLKYIRCIKNISGVRLLLLAISKHLFP